MLISELVSLTFLKPSPETIPTSADDVDDSMAHGEQSDDTCDPLSFEEYSASAERRRSRLSGIAKHAPTYRTNIGKSHVSHVPSFEKTNRATTAVSRLDWPQTAAADQSHDNAAETEDERVERPRKKPRTTLLEIPIWTQPGLSQGQIPKTSWDRHWSRKRNPKTRTFDEHGNKITTKREIQERQRREQGMRPRPRLGKDSVKPKSETNQPTDRTTEVDVEVKLEHTCLSDEVASICLACAKEEESGCGAQRNDDRIIDPAVAQRLLLEHTCLSGSAAGPCIACEKGNETQSEDESDLVGSKQQTHESKGRQSRDSEGLNREKITHSPGVGQQGGPSNSAHHRPETRDDSGEEPEEYDWENNSNIPKPQYINRIVKYYSKRKPFTPEEDRLIIQMYEEQNKNWDDIMEAIRRRSRGQLQYRYYTTLRSENWREKRAAAADAIKQQNLAEVERTRRQKAAEVSVRSLSGSLFEKPKKKSSGRRRNPVKKAEEDSEWDEWLKARPPLDPAFLPPLEDDCPSPEFFSTVLPALGLSGSGHDKSQTPPDPSQVSVQLHTEPVPSQIEGVPMEPATQLSHPYERLYPKVYSYARIDETDGSLEEIDLI
jgi:hypothetical protein